jgi:hypothetical protein
MKITKKKKTYITHKSEVIPHNKEIEKELEKEN